MTSSPRGRWVNSLRARLLIAIGVIVALSIGLTLAIGYVLTQREVERATLRDISHLADLLARSESGSVSPLRLDRLEDIFHSQGEQVREVPLNRPSPYLPSEARRSVLRNQGFEGKMRVNGQSYYFAARPVLNRAFVLLRPTHLSASDSRAYLQGFLIAGLIGAALAALASFLLARAISRPVRRVAEASRHLAIERSPEPVPVEGPNELASLAESFNEMAEDLARARAAERSFLLSVSHELKTPLTSIRGYAEGLAEGAVPVHEAAETMAREANRLERLVRDLLDLARMNRSEFSIHSEPIDLGGVAGEAAARHEDQARSFGIWLEAVTSGPAPALGDMDRVVQVVSNLVENALRIVPAGGFVRVIAEPGTIIVEDSGPGLKPEELPRAFDRFFLWSRYGGERPVGTGLGLAIVKQLTEGMGGTVEVRSESAKPTRFIVRLPPSSTPEPAEPAEASLARA